MRELKLQIIKQLEPVLSKEGFKWVASKSTFYRETGSGFHSFIVIFKDYNDRYEVYASIGIRNDKVENFFHLTSGFESKYQKYTPTIGVFIYEYDKNSNHRYLLKDESDLNMVIEGLISDYNDIASKYYKEFDDIHVMDKILNDLPSEYCVHKPTIPLKAQTGLILAKLVNRGNYKEIEKIYREILEEVDNGFYLQYFIPLSNNLSSQ